MPKVSIIIPVYGVEKYIERCARSLFEQTLHDIEYLFVDDCTPDSSIDVLRQVLDEYPERKRQVVIHRMENNCGQAAVRVWGIQNAIGDFIIHCDSDDWVEPDYCKVMYEAAIQNCADAVICDYVMTDEKQIIHRVKGCSSTDKLHFINEMLLQRDPWSLCNKLFRRTVCYNNDLLLPTGNMGEDMLIAFQMVLNASKIAYVAYPLYNYFYNPTSITRTSSEDITLRNFYHFKKNIDLLCEVLQSRGLYNQLYQGTLSCKWFAKKFLWNLHFDNEIRTLWRVTYPELGNYILHRGGPFTNKDKVKYILTDLGLYPMNNYESK